ncbi:MAG: hypothetical protein EOM03_14250, partial [Clostridia bacterium]|nr:hypothetical protein [Clostridia bacterium]
MSDLIDRDALRDEVLNDNTFDNDTVNYYLATIDGAPTIDATPVDLALNVIIRYAIRYAYGRGDPAPTAVMVEYVRPLVPKLSSETLVVIERDLHCADTGVG